VGQKVHPGGMRLGIIHDWKAQWYTEKQFAGFLQEDLAIRKHIQQKMGHAGLSTIIIRKDTNKVVVAFTLPARASSSVSRARKSTRSGATCTT
jgi:small subunit ribosomal protein S3